MHCHLLNNSQDLQFHYSSISREKKGRGWQKGGRIKIIGMIAENEKEAKKAEKVERTRRWWAKEHTKREDGSFILWAFKKTINWRSTEQTAVYTTEQSSPMAWAYDQVKAKEWQKKGEMRAVACERCVRETREWINNRDHLRKESKWLETIDSSKYDLFNFQLLKRERTELCVVL